MAFFAASSNPSNACKGRPLSAICHLHQQPFRSPYTIIETEKNTYHLLTKLFICPAQPHHDRHLHVQVTESQDDALGDHVTASQTAKDVDEDGLDAGVRADDPEGRLDGLRGGFAAGVEEVGAVATVDCECVDRVHGKACSVD